VSLKNRRTEDSLGDKADLLDNDGRTPWMGSSKLQVWRIGGERFVIAHGKVWVVGLSMLYFVSGCAPIGSTQPETNVHGKDLAVVTKIPVPMSPKGTQWVTVPLGGGETLHYPAPMVDLNKPSETVISWRPYVTQVGQGIVWISQPQSNQLMESDAASTYLTTAKSKVIYQIPITKMEDGVPYLGSIVSVHRDSADPKYLLVGQLYAQKQNSYISSLDLYGLNMETGQVKEITTNIHVNGGGYLFQIDLYRHFVIYDQRTPTISGYMDHVYLYDLNTGKRFLRVQEDLELRKTPFTVVLDGSTYVPKWIAYEDWMLNFMAW